MTAPRLTLATGSLYLYSLDRIFALAAEYGRVSSHKADDMRQQQGAARGAAGRIASAGGSLATRVADAIAPTTPAKTLTPTPIDMTLGSSSNASTETSCRR